MTLYRHKNTGFTVAAEELKATKRQDDEWAKRWGKPTKNPAIGDFALWWGGRHLKYMDRAAFLAEYEAL